MDTGNDPRFLLLGRAVDEVSAAVKGGRLRAQIPKTQVLATLEELKGHLMAVRYSYAEPDEIRKSDAFQALLQTGARIQELLGGPSWHEKVPQDALAVATVRWFLDNVSTLPSRLDLPPEPDSAIDLLAGRVLTAGKHPQADKLVVTRVGAGRATLRVVTNDTTVGTDAHVAVALLPPVDLRGVISEGMFCGAGAGVLKDIQAEPGTRPHLPAPALAEMRSQVVAWIRG